MVRCPTLCCLKISIKGLRQHFLSQLRHQMLLASPLIADVMGLNAAVCDFTGIHPVQCSTKGKTRKRDTVSKSWRERCVIILHYHHLFYFPQQQRKRSCRNDSYQSKDGRCVSAAEGRFTVCLQFVIVCMCCGSSQADRFVSLLRINT